MDKIHRQAKQIIDLVAKVEAADRDIKVLQELIATKDEIAYQAHLKAKADAERLRAALEKVEWDAEWGDCLWCNRNRNQGHAPTCARQAALHGEQEGAAKEGEGK